MYCGTQGDNKDKSTNAVQQYYTMTYLIHLAVVGHYGADIAKNILYNYYGVKCLWLSTYRLLFSRCSVGTVLCIVMLLFLAGALP